MLASDVAARAVIGTSALPAAPAMKARRSKPDGLELELSGMNGLRRVRIEPRTPAPLLALQL